MLFKNVNLKREPSERFPFRVFSADFRNRTEADRYAQNIFVFLAASRALCYIFINRETGNQP